MSEERLDRRYFARNGGALITTNLNADSQHPNPWRPKTVYEAAWFVNMGNMNLLDNQQPALKKRHMDFESVGLGGNLAYYGTVGARIGICHGSFDAINITKVTTFSAGLARTLYITVPWVGMFTSYAATYHLVNNWSQEKHKPRHYAIAALAPGTVWGVFKRSPWSGAHVAFWWGLTTALVKYSNDNGFGFGPMTAPLFNRELFNQPGWGNNPELETARDTGITPNHWKDYDKPMWPFRGFDEGGVNDQKWNIAPDWHKHVSEEERKKGPGVI